MTESYYIDLPYACFGVEVEEGIVIRTPPIGHWMMGKDIKTIIGWVKKKKGTIKKNSIGQ